MKLALALLVALGAAKDLAAQVPDIGTPPGRMVGIGGRTLHLHCTGAGSPTVVFEAGASSFAIDFSLVQQEVARTNRVCSDDRAGQGWSDSSTAATRASEQHDLHALLEKAGEAPPYILVGASLGGLFVRLYQAEYPAHVTGMVLIDAATENRMFTFFEGQAVTIASLTADQLRSTIAPRDVRVPRRSPQTGAPFDRLPPPLYELRIKLEQGLIAAVPDIVPYLIVLEGAERQRGRLAQLLALSATQAHPLGDRPLVVLTRGVEWSQGLQEAHASLARLSSNSRHTVVAGAGHEIHLFEPHAVIQAISDVIEAARTKARLAAR